MVCQWWRPNFEPQLVCIPIFIFHYLRWIFSIPTFLPTSQSQKNARNFLLSNYLKTVRPPSSFSSSYSSLFRTYDYSSFRKMISSTCRTSIVTLQMNCCRFILPLPPLFPAFRILIAFAGIFAVPKNMKLLAVPLFELYDNVQRYP